MEVDTFKKDVYIHLADNEKIISYLYDNMGILSDNINSNINNYDQSTAKNILSINLSNVSINDNDCIISIYKKIVINLCNSLSSINLNSDEEFKEPSYYSLYVTNVCNNEFKIKLFILYIHIYYVETFYRSKINEHSILCIDCEYSRSRKIELIQLGFECSVINDNALNFIFIINPYIFNNVNLSLFIDMIFLNKNIDKIMHGADALDIPHIFDELFNMDVDKIKKFTHTLIDTRFMCEYYKNSKKEEKICNIYEALKSINVITDDRYDYLKNTQDSRGPIQDILWDIHKLSSFHVKYALYDVIFLKPLLYNILKMAKKTEYTNAYKYIPQLIQFNLIEKYSTSTIIIPVKKEVDIANNYIIRTNGENNTLISIYNKLIVDITLKETQINLSFIYGVNLLKTTFAIFAKRVIYHILCTKFKVWKKRNDRYYDKLSLDSLLNTLKSNGYDNIYTIINDMYNTFNNIIN
jgi:hypothetical protein